MQLQSIDWNSKKDIFFECWQSVFLLKSGRDYKARRFRLKGIEARPVPFISPLALVFSSDPVRKTGCQQSNIHCQEYSLTHPEEILGFVSANILGNFGRGSAAKTRTSHLSYLLQQPCHLARRLVFEPCRVA